MTLREKKVLLTGMLMGLFLKGCLGRVTPDNFDNTWPVEFTWSGISGNPAFRVSATSNPFYKVSDLVATTDEMQAFAVSANGTELTVTALSEKEGYTLGMWYNATADTTISLLCVRDLELTNANGQWTAPATGLYVRYTSDPDDALYAVEKTEAVETALYLYGTPSDSGNVAVKSGDTTTLYNGAVAPSLPEWDKEAYPYATIITTTSDGDEVYYLLLRSEASKVYTSGSITALGSKFKAENGEWVEISNASGGKIIWANYDVHYHDDAEAVGGTVYLSTTEPLPITTGIVAYLYNGVQLPDIYSVYTPELQEQYPYVYIGKTGMTYTLYKVCFTDSLQTAANVSKIISMADEVYELADRKWVASSIGSGFQAIWANTDIYYKDSLEEIGGTLCLATSDPIPVYE